MNISSPTWHRSFIIPKVFVRNNALQVLQASNFILPTFNDTAVALLGHGGYSHSIDMAYVSQVLGVKPSPLLLTAGFTPPVCESPS